MSDDCPICGSYEPKRYGPCSPQCRWLDRNLTIDQLAEMKHFVAMERAAERRRGEEAERQRELYQLNRLKEKYPNAYQS